MKPMMLMLKFPDVLKINEFEYCDSNYQYCFACLKFLGRHYFNLDAERLGKEGQILSSYQYKKLF